ncbi:MAG: hypothetical protein KA436_06140 [Oligoflexales bacterium]|nr:hypothetical protein [Oligoflexales bacterium]
MGQDNLATKAQVSTSDEQEPGSTEELEFINPSPEEQLSLIESMSEDGAFVLEE